MLRFACPACHAVIEAPDDRAESKARCSGCGQLFLVPSHEAAKVTVCDDRHTLAASSDDESKLRNVNYLHHTRDNDGDVIIYFSDPISVSGGVGVLKSSPVATMRRLQSGVVDRGGVGKTRYILTTQNHEYMVHMTRDQAAHLAMELGVALPE